MKKATFSSFLRLLVLFLVVVLFPAAVAWAKPTTAAQAKTVVLNWLHLDAHPLGTPLGNQVKQVKKYNYNGTPAYYVVFLNPTGMVFVSADDLVEPIIGFSPESTYNASPTNPLGALVSRDIPGRVQEARDIESHGLMALARQSPQAAAQRKWARLEATTSNLQTLESGLSSVSDLRVAPFVQSRWSQSTVNGQACYNYFTPPFSNGPGSPYNYVCGCVATAMAQLMRYWQYPAAPVVGTFPIEVDGVSQNATIRGGDGSGGDYDWSDMVLDPLAGGNTETERAAIGALTYDAGVAAQMDYAADGSGTDLYYATTALLNTFQYSNAILGEDWTGSGFANLPATNRNNMVNADLDAHYPVLFGITTPSGEGHAVVCDGYGYDDSTMYHHLNLGWSGYDDAWYNLPTINTTPYDFNSIIECVYNIYTSGSGEIISGRVTDDNGNPISGATVSASGGYTATTDAHGIYALTQVPSNTQFTVTVTKTGYSFPPQTVTTGTSTDYTATTGNVWGVDFVGGSDTPGVPTLTTTAVSSITTRSALSGGDVTSDGGLSVTARGVCWSTSSNPTTSDDCTQDGEGKGSFTSTLSGLQVGTTYHVRAYATNSAGTAYGNDIQFNTLRGMAMPWLQVLLN